jgi:hypothetical protein
MAGLLNALPCTPLMARLQKQGRLIQASSGNNSDGVINFIPYHFSMQQAEQNYLRILQGIYHPQAYFDRVMRHLALIDPDLQSNYRSGNKKLSYLVKILSKKHALTYWRYLPRVLAIANRRCGSNQSGYSAILAEYFSLCGQYTHFSAQIRLQQKQITQRDYADYQRLSWRERQDASATKERV